MKLTSILLASSALTLAAGAASAIDLTFVSWGGAYQNSQLKAYAEPYMAMHPDVHIAWDESSAEAVAKLRAMNEAGNVTWDLVDVTVCCNQVEMSPRLQSRNVIRWRDESKA